MTYASINGERAIRVRLHVPPIGPWWADVDLDATAPTLSGRVTLALGELSLSGTIDASHDGTHAGARSLRVVAGAGAWATLLPAKAYHNDAQIRALTVASDAAREAGEQLSASFAPSAERIGVDYVRQAGPASRVLEDVIGGAAWWVDYDGVTQVGERASAEASPDDYEVLEHEPAEHVITLAVDDLTTIGIGSVLTERLDEPQTVRELEIEYGAESFRVKAWTGEDGGHGRIDRALRSIVARYTDARIYGPRKYRVIRMASGRVELQVVRRSAGLPDILPITMWPGVAGAYAELQPGAEVLVEFIDGLPTEPIITHFAGKDGAGFVPVRLTLGATGSAPNAAREGDTVRVTIPAGTFIVSVAGGSGAPATGALNPTDVEVDGEITSGSSKVGIG